MEMDCREIDAKLSSSHEPQFSKFTMHVFFESIGQFVVLRVRIIVRSAVGNDPVEIRDEEARMDVVAIF